MPCPAGPDRDGGSPALAALADPHREHGRRSPWSAGLGRGRSAHQARRSWAWWATMPGSAGRVCGPADAG